MCASQIFYILYTLFLCLSTRVGANFVKYWCSAYLTGKGREQVSKIIWQNCHLWKIFQTEFVRKFTFTLFLIKIRVPILENYDATFTVCTKCAGCPSRLNQVIYLLPFSSAPNLPHCFQTWPGISMCEMYDSGKTMRRRCEMFGWGNFHWKHDAAEMIQLLVSSFPSSSSL